MNNLMLFRKYLLIVIIILSYGKALAYTYDDQQNNIRLIDRIDKLEYDLNTIQKQFYKSSSFKQAGKAVAIDGNVISSLDSRIDIVEENLREMVGKIEQIEHNIGNLNRKFEQLVKNNAASHSNKLDSPLSTNDQPAAIINGTTQASPKTLGTVDTKLVENIKQDSQSFDDSAEEEFKKAFTLLKTSRLQEAIKAFNQFIKKNPNSNLTCEAYYWLGEINYTQKNYEQASINFLRGYKLAPQGEKAADSLLKLAISLKHLQKVKDSCVMLGKLSTNFTNLSEAIKGKINQMNAELGCK